MQLVVPVVQVKGNPKNREISGRNILQNPKGPSTQYLGTWDLGNGNFSTGFGEVYDYWVLGPLGKGFSGASMYISGRVIA